MITWTLISGQTPIATFISDSSDFSRIARAADVLRIYSGVSQWRVAWSDRPGDEIVISDRPSEWLLMINSRVKAKGSLVEMLQVAAYHELLIAERKNLAEQLAQCLKTANLGSPATSGEDAAVILLNELQIARRKVARTERDAEILSYLMAAGINNTTAFEEGMRAYHEEHPSDD